MAIIPRITVKNVDNVPAGAPGVAGKVAIVAEFSGEQTQPVSVNTYYESLEKLVTTTPITAESPMGDKCLESLFRGGATDIVAVDLSPTSAGKPTGAEIVAAATSLEEKYDILLIPYVLEDNYLTAIKTYIDDRFTGSRPVGLIAPVTRTNLSGYQATAAIFKDGGLFGLINQQYTVNDVELSVEQSACYYAGLLCTKKVDNSMTMKQLLGVTNIKPELTFNAPSEDNGTGDEGYELVKAGYPVAKCLNRASETYVVVNSRLPHTVTATDGTVVNLDLYMERTINYILNLLNLEDYLGEKNNPTSLDAIAQRMGSIKYNIVNDLGLVNDIIYDVEKVNRDCVEVNVNEIVFDGVITEINANATYDIN